jgi:hypothetical protein
MSSTRLGPLPNVYNVNWTPFCDVPMTVERVSANAGGAVNDAPSVRQSAIVAQRPQFNTFKPLR